MPPQLITYNPFFYKASNEVQDLGYVSPAQVMAGEEGFFSAPAIFSLSKINSKVTFRAFVSSLTGTAG